jgi:Protein of unknown function (DUF3987)
MKQAIKYDTLNEAEANATRGEVIVMFIDNKFAPMYPSDVAADALLRGAVLAVMYDAADAAWDGAQFSSPVYGTKFEALTHCPGLVGEVIDLVCSASRRPNRSAALGTALTVLGTLGGRYVMGPTRSGTHLYILALMPVGAGKDDIMTAALELLYQCDLTHLGGPESMSESAILNWLARQPLSLCTWDEFGMVLNKLNAARAGAHEINILKGMNTAWGRSFKLMKKHERAGEKTEDIWWPAMSIIAATTPETFWDSLKKAQMDNGFVSRLLVMPASPRAARTDPKPIILDWQTVANLKQLHPQPLAGQFPIYKDDDGKEHDDKSKPQYDVHQIGWTDQAKACFDAYEQRCLDRIDAKYSDGFFIARNAEMAIRIATIRRLGIDGIKHGSEIDIDDMLWAIDIVEICSSELIERAANAMTPEQLKEYELKQLIIEQVKAGSEAGPGGETCISDRMLKRKLQKHADADPVTKALAQLIDSATIAYIEDTVGKSKGWWRWCAQD